MDDYELIQDRSEVEKAFGALSAATPRNFQADFERMMLMYRVGDAYRFKHRDMRRGFDFNIVTGEFSGEGVEGPITTVEEAYEWARS